jgi:hypothetical protein
MHVYLNLLMRFLNRNKPETSHERDDQKQIYTKNEYETGLYLACSCGSPVDENLQHPDLSFLRSSRESASI